MTGLGLGRVIAPPQRGCDRAFPQYRHFFLQRSPSIRL